MRKRLLFMLLAVFLVMTGCSSGKETPETDKQSKTADVSAAKEEAKEKAAETEKKAAQEEKELQKYKETDPVAMMQAEPGEFSGDQYDVEEVKKQIDRFPAGEEPEDYYYRTLALIAEDYRPYHAFFSQVDTSYADNSAAPDERIESPGKKPGAQANVTILFDASGSMGAKIGNKTMMDTAKEAVNDFLSKLPEGVHVSLRAYGHKGTGSEDDKAKSCKSSEEVYALSAYDKNKMKKALDKFSPAGWTPLAASIRDAGNDLKKQTGENVENIVYVVSDGVETCGGNPVKEAKKLHESDIQAIVNIIGFDVDDAGQKALKEVAEAGKGAYTTVHTKQELENFFRQEKAELLNEWNSWEVENVNEINASQVERVNELNSQENEMVTKAQQEENNLVGLSRYIEEKFDVKGYAIRDKARKRGVDLRNYARKTAVDFRNELRKEGLDNRNEVREKSRKARDSARNSDKD